MATFRVSKQAANVLNKNIVYFILLKIVVLAEIHVRLHVELNKEK